MRVQDAGTLTFTRALDNSGTLEAIRSRIVVWGPLAQLKHTRSDDGIVFTEWAGGRLVADHGSIHLNFGESHASNPNWRPHLWSNRGELIFKGAQARLTTAWLLHDRVSNAGQLSVLDGAELRQRLSLDNIGRVEIGEGSRIDTSSYSQNYDRDQPDAQTQIAGTLSAEYRMDFYSGALGAGLDDNIGVAHMLGADVWLLSRSMLDVDIASAGSFDRFVLDHALRLYDEARLVVEFDLATSVIGSYRIVEAAGGVLGSFASLGTNLDASLYRWSVVYGDTYVDLTVAAVPEPGTYAMMALGLLGLGAASRRRAR